MESNELDSRLSRIRTQWSAVIAAHGAADEVNATRNALIHRYLGAVYRYLLGAVRDPELAGELSQEFALRFLRGDFRAAQPSRGRFRDYVRTVLVNLVNDSHRARQVRPLHLSEHGPQPPVAPQDVSDDDRDFLVSWREELLARTWSCLAEENKVYHATLKLRIEEPDLTSPAMAECLTVELGRPMSADYVRKCLGRAQAKFAELLFAEVSTSLGTTVPEELERELSTLDLLRYCRSAWERYKSQH